ncbi:hypothetical protein IGS75_12425 [Gluconobacter sphaericus]|uniref:hypothetical protein n=1 Tax=Gluconobacter sphaericus TaxID=574987 RepID=UPI0019249B18|nr:hypothetical protein [Gluconobacter sphaericus]QQX90924.1 hypothetical protein IGS75_12425 [Gluconobacter sphaericus]
MMKKCTKINQKNILALWIKEIHYIFEMILAKPEYNLLVFWVAMRRRVTAALYRSPMVLDAPITGHSSQSYVDCVVIPDLRPGDIVIMENLGSHKGPGVQAAIEAADADCALFHALQPELQPHREGLLRTQGPSPQKSQNVHAISCETGSAY